MFTKYNSQTARMLLSVRDSKIYILSVGSERAKVLWQRVSDGTRRGCKHKYLVSLQHLSRKASSLVSSVH